jgi:CheY-like chemotaxis protein
MRKLLLADDSVTIQRVIELTFSGEDIQVIAVNDGEQAMARIPAEQPDVVLADIGMPRKGGYDVAAFVKGRPDLSHIPVLLLAGAFEPVDQTRAEQVGANGVLIKPFEPRQVIERVRELLAAVRPTISAEVVPDPSAFVEAAAPVPAVIEAEPVQSSAQVSPEAPAEAQFQSLDDLFESLNQALTERATSATPEAPPAPRVGPVAAPSVPPPPVIPPAVETLLEALPSRPATSWPVEKEWMIPTMADESSASFDRASFPDASFDSAPFDAARTPLTSAATLDDYFDRLSAAFSHSRTADPSETLPDPVEDFGRAVASEPPVASHEWLGQGGEPEGLLAFESGESAGNPILGAVSALMARAQSHHDMGEVSHDKHPINGTSTAPFPPASSTAQPSPSAELVDLVTERVLARLVPELTESLRRLVQQEITRAR